MLIEVKKQPINKDVIIQIDPKRPLDNIKNVIFRGNAMILDGVEMKDFKKIELLQEKLINMKYIDGVILFKYVKASFCKFILLNYDLVLINGRSKFRKSSISFYSKSTPGNPVFVLRIADHKLHKSHNAQKPIFFDIGDTENSYYYYVSKKDDNRYICVQMNKFTKMINKRELFLAYQMYDSIWNAQAQIIKKNV